MGMQSGERKCCARHYACWRAVVIAVLVALPVVTGGCDVRPAQRAARRTYDAQPPGRVTILEVGKVVGTMKPGAFKKGDSLVVIHGDDRVGSLKVTDVQTPVTFTAEIVGDDGIKAGDAVAKRDQMP